MVPGGVCGHKDPPGSGATVAEALPEHIVVCTILDVEVLKLAKVAGLVIVEDNEDNDDDEAAVED